MGTVFLSPDKVWSYYIEHRSELVNSDKLIAENREYGIDIVISGFMQGYCTILVSADDSPVYEEDVNCARDCEAMVRMLYDNYLSIDALDLLDAKDIEEFNSLEEKEEISVREADLDDAVWALVEAAIDRSKIFDQDLCDDLKEHFLEYMWKKHKLQIYRPMYLVDENNEQFFEEYPYECMVFDE